MLRFFVRFKFTVSLPVLAGLIGCAAPIPVTEPPPTTASPNYVDFQPGWRIRTVTPILNSGKFKPEFKETAVAGAGAQLSAGDDFIGYETSYYAVMPGKDSGVPRYPESLMLAVS